jgi:hypothetical protein
MVTDTAIGVVAAAKLIGVTRARVYQRINGTTGAEENMRPQTRLASVQDVRISRTTGKAQSITLIPVAAAMQWRTERIAAGLPVGPMLDNAAPVVHAPSDEPGPDGAVGIPSMRAY